MRITIPFVQGFNNVAAGGMATTKLPRNKRYFGVVLQYKTNANQATIEADITQIRVKVNSKVVMAFSAAELFIINALNGITFSAGLIPIWFAQPKRRTLAGEELLAWLIYEELGIGDVEIEVDIAGAAAAPTLSGVMTYDFAKPADQMANAGLRTVMHRIRTVLPCAAAFTASAPMQPPSVIPAVNGFLHRMHAFDPVVTKIALLEAQSQIYSVDSLQLPALLQPYGMAKQANTMHAVLDYDQQYNDGLFIPSVSSLNVQFVTSGAATGGQFVLIQEIRKSFDLS
jgi:hypothetical protein